MHVGGKLRFIALEATLIGILFISKKPSIKKSYQSYPKSPNDGMSRGPSSKADIPDGVDGVDVSNSLLLMNLI